MQNFSVSHFPHLHIHPKSAFGSQPVLPLSSAWLLSPHSCCEERVYEWVGKQTKPRTWLSFNDIISRFGKSRFSFKLNSLFPGSLWAYAGLSPAPSSLLLHMPYSRRTSLYAILVSTGHPATEEFPLYLFSFHLAIYQNGPLSPGEIGKSVLPAHWGKQDVDPLGRVMLQSPGGIWKL